MNKIFLRFFFALATFFQTEKRNDAERLKYLTQSAEIGNPIALGLMATAYNPGSSCAIKKDVSRACVYYQYASARGFVLASLELAKLQIEGSSIPMNLIAAIKLVRRVLESPTPTQYQLFNFEIRQTANLLLLNIVRRNYFIYSWNIISFQPSDYIDQLFETVQFQNWITILYHASAVYDLENSEKPALFSNIVNLAMSSSDWKIKSLYNILKLQKEFHSNIPSYAQYYPDFFAKLICQEENPKAVIKSLSYWFGESISEILKNKQVQEKLEEITVPELSEIDSYLQENVFQTAQQLSKIVTSYLPKTYKVSLFTQPNNIVVESSKTQCSDYKHSNM